MKENTVFFVTDMTCGHCEKVLRAALAATLPGALVGIDLVAHRVAVGGDARLAEAAIREAGYSPERLGG